MVRLIQFAQNKADMMAAGSIIFLGDSITEGWGVCFPEWFSSQGFVNCGRGGETSGQIRRRLSSILNEIPAPAGLHLLCGINDIAENEGPVTNEAIQDNVAAMLVRTRDLGIRTWVGSITPADRVCWRACIQPRPRIAEMNTWLRAQVGRWGAQYLNYHAVLATASGGLRPGYGTDGLHLSPAGYKAIEPTLLAAISGERTFETVGE